MKPYGMTADLEFMPWTAVPHARAALSVIEAAGMPPNAGILVDALHFDRSATTLDDIRAGLFAALPADLPVSVEVVHLERMRAMDPAEWARQCLEASRRYL